MNKTAICLIIVFLIVISIISYLLLSPCPDGKEKKGFKCVDKADASTTSSQRPKLVGVASGCTSAAPFRNEGSCVASCPVGKVADSTENCIVPRQIIPLGGKTATCPQSHSLKEYGTCVNACAPGLFKSGTNCLPMCPTGTVLHNGECIASCPTGMFRDLSNGVTPVCRTSCPSVRPANGSVCQSCSSRTPSQVNNNGSCMTACPAGTYRNDISMCMLINPLAAEVVTKTRISEGFSPNQRFVNMTDGNFNNVYNPTNTTNPTWVYFQNVTKSGQLLYGFTIKFGREGGDPNVNLKIYNNNTTLTDNNKIFDETFLNVGGEIMVRRSFNPPINVTNLYLLFSRWIYIHEFEVTVR
jgi:hypothetical protein